jgi:hypothetical protein
MRLFIVVFALALSVAGCGENIRACAEGCARSFKSMASYSDTAGCVCGEPVKEPAK